MLDQLFHGDNLDVLGSQVADGSIDLIHLDPLSNSDAGYDVLSKQAGGAGADASIEAFDDARTWGEASRAALLDIAGGADRPLPVMMEAIRGNPLMAHPAMTAMRLVELHRVLGDVTDAIP